MDKNKNVGQKSNKKCVKNMLQLLKIGLKIKIMVKNGKNHEIKKNGIFV